MIKEQCNNCRKNGTDYCTQDIVYDNISCEQYYKKIDLTKPTESQDDSTMQRENNHNSSYTTETVNKSFLASLFSFKGRTRRTRYWLINIFTSLMFVPANLEGTIYQME